MYAAFFRQVEDDEAYYGGHFERLVKLPEGFNLTVPVTLRAIVDEAIDNIVPEDIHITYPPRRLGSKPEADADMVRQFLKAVWKHWRINSDGDPIRELGKNGFVSGLMATKLVPDWTLWPNLSDEEEKKLLDEDASGKKTKERVKKIKDMRSKSFPLVFRSLPPRCIIADPSVGGRKLWMIERYQAATEEVTGMYAKFDEAFRTTMIRGAKHKIHELWTANYIDYKGAFVQGKHWVFVDEEVQLEEDNPWDDLPYKVKGGGFGRDTYEGRPEDKFVGFYSPQVKSLGRAEARRISQLEAIVAQLAFPIFVLPDKVGDLDFDTTPGAVNFVPEDVYNSSDRMFLKIPIPDQAIMTSLSAISSQIERGTTQAAVRGVAIPGTDSAAQYGMYSQQAKLRLAATQIALEDILSWAFARVLYYIDEVLQDRVNVPVSDTDGVAQYSLSPGNIQGHYDVVVKFMPSEESEKGRKLALASDAIVKGGLSPYDALTFAGFDNATEIIARRMAYDVMNEPPVKRAIGKSILKEWGIDADVAAMEEQADQAKQQMMLSQIMQILQTGTLRDAGSEQAPNAPMPPNMAGNNQDPMAALAQQGMGPMPMPQGAPPMDPMLQPPQMVQQ